MKQVFLNLILNAKDAMPEGGKLVIKSGMEDAKNIVVEITDNGRGIPESMIDKIFDPFFTTKDDGEGVGIGLSIVMSALKRNNGDIKVKSKEARGTTFTIHLPVHKTEN